MHLKNFFRQIQVRVPIILNLYHQNQSQISPEPKEERRNRRNSVQVTGKVGSRKQIETRDPLLSCPSLLRVTRSAARLIITKAEQGQHSLFRKSLSARLIKVLIPESDGGHLRLIQPFRGRLSQQQKKRLRGTSIASKRYLDARSS
jgi:hypothetical protein